MGRFGEEIQDVTGPLRIGVWTTAISVESINTAGSKTTVGGVRVSGTLGVAVVAKEGDAQKTATRRAKYFMGA